MANHHPTDSSGTANTILWLGIRFALVLTCVALAAFGFDWLRGQIAFLESDASARAMTGLILAVLVVYAIILAVPFMPGVEIGVALLIIQGATAAPVVYAATVGGLSLAFLVGQTVSLLWLIRVLQDLRLRRIAGWLERIDAVPRADRLTAMQDKLPRWLVPFVVKYRYATVALAINTPGNIAVGGGGGIMLVAGLSRLFSTPATLLVVALATAPVPLAVWLWGVDVVR
ncbi:hypothetical protein [Yoonia vestfoldensis]|uniref:hypothetical protein n=1 Tax=Yoonia vestfoldensis TaxID=245188 RepID=UPI00036E74D3|nr:hypothetical protein [Yoonia vestfoldensis]